MKTTITRRTCDVCHEHQDYDCSLFVGMLAFKGWMRLEIVEPLRNRQIDVCSLACLDKLLEPMRKGNT